MKKNRDEFLAYRYAIFHALVRVINKEPRRFCGTRDTEV